MVLFIICYKMAKNNAAITFCANSVQENEKMLHESCFKSQVDIKNKKDYEKLFIKLNYICQIKSTKEGIQLNSWCNKNVISCIYGPISGFPSGSWWGIRMDCSRDRVHDPFDENVQNGPFGVTSICTSSINLNEDVDLGKCLTLTGKKYCAEQLDKDPLIQNYENQIPVRLIRSYNLFNEFAPKTGYRYDGLYIVINFWIGISSNAVKYYKFALLRLNDQEPPSWNIKPALLSINTSTLHSTPTSVRNCIKNSAPNIYEFKRYSHGLQTTIQKKKYENSNEFSQLQNIENKKIERKKNTTESAIVTRHVFKKLNTNTECASNLPNMSVISENKSLTHIGSRGSKTHNTNISIRTGLYNSSHSTKNESKKNTSSPFCRTAKSLNILKTNQHIENWNLSNKDKKRNLDGKTQTVTSSEFPKRINYISFNTVKPDSRKIKFPKDISAEIKSDTNNTNSNSCYRFECNITHKETPNDAKDICSSTLSSSDITTSMLNMTNCMYKNEVSAHKKVSKEVKELKSLDSLDSMTPDKILHLINNKNHPLSNLLMSNMIGLTSEQTIALETGEIVTAKSEVKDKIVTQNSNKEAIKEKTKFEVISDDLSGSRCYKFRRRRKLSRKIMNKTEMIKYNKIHNEKFKKGSVQSSDILEYSRKDKRETDICKDLKNKSIQQKHVQKREPNCLANSTRYIKKNTGNTIEARMHLQMRAIDSSIKKHINKKQRREITNLLIDAKIEPKIRGPRYRRLRCINNEYTKQSYEHFNTTMYTLNKCKVKSERSSFQNRNKLRKITSCKRVKRKQTRNVKRSETLNLKHNKISRNLTVSKKAGKNHIVKQTVNNNTNLNKNESNNMSDKKDNGKTSKFVKKNVKIVGNEDVTIIKNRKRKLMQSVYKDSKCNKIDEKPYKNYEQEISKPCKTDAVTQCSLLKEPLAKNLKSGSYVQNNVRNEQYTFIKIEYGDFKDMKSEIYEAMRSDNENKSYTSQTEEKCVSCTETVYNLQQPMNTNVPLNNSILSTKEQNKFPPERVSAFVPVNIPDNDIKIARLRSIGFKPINFNNSSEDINDQDKGNKILKQSVTEKYNKYTNEENDIVVYMDDELQYQDIEDEDKNSLPIKCKEKESYNSLLEQDLESPWHGWKKIVTNKDTYWIGW